MTSKETRGGRGNPRFHVRTPSKMLTRQGDPGRDPDEVDESIMDKAIADAGAFDPGMTTAEKKDLYKVLIDSKVNQVEQKTQRLSLDSHPSPSQNNAQSSSSSKEQSDLVSSQSSPAGRKHIEQTISEPTKQDDQHPLSRGRLKDDVTEERRPGSVPGPARKGGVGKGTGRGRAVPTMATKYPPLPLSSPGQDRSSSYPPSPQNNPTSPTSSTLASDNYPSTKEDSPTSPQISRAQLSSVCSSPDLGQTRTDSPKSSEACPDTSDIEQDKEDVRVDETVKKEDDVPDMSEESELQPSSTNDGETKADSPSSADVEMEGAVGTVKESAETVQIGKVTALVSPFERLLKPVEYCSVLPHFKEIEKFRGDKTEWLIHAREIVQLHREAHWDRLLVECPQWGPPIRDGGNKRSLFKQAVPKYSKCFDNSSDFSNLSKPVTSSSGRSERQSKTQAKAKIQDALFEEPEYHNFRRSKQKQGKQEETTKADRDDDDVQCIEDGTDSVVGSNDWPSIEQRRSHPGVLELSPASPCDVYAFPNDEDDEEWPAEASKNKKNNKRGCKGPQDNSIECRPPQRGNGAPPQNQRGRNTKLRLQKGDIARPSQHATTSNNLRNRGAQSEQFEDPQSNSNSETRDGRNVNRSDSENPGDISAMKFYNNPKVVHPRTPAAAPQRRNFRENQRSNDFVSSAGPSGISHGRQSDEPAEQRVPCPICNTPFPLSKIEEHADTCFNYMGDGVGEEPVSSSQGSEDSIKAVDEAVEKVKPRPQEGNQVLDIECSRCKEHITRQEVEQHKQICNSAVDPNSGHKRASSDQNDDGPARKTTRYLN